jgi:hypothetical protein
MITVTQIQKLDLKIPSMRKLYLATSPATDIRTDRVYWIN